MDDAEIVRIPYLYFMDTTDLAEIANGNQGNTRFDIVYDDKYTVSIFYKPASIAGCTRSIVNFCHANKNDGSERYFNRLSWTKRDAHMFFVSDPYYYRLSNNVEMPDAGYYMNEAFPVLHAILLKFHQLLGVAFCKFIGYGSSAFALLMLSANYEEIAPWTMTLAINPHLNPSGSRIVKIEQMVGHKMNWTIDFDKIKQKVDLGKHLFFVLQNRLDTAHYTTFLNFKDKMVNGGVQGWSFQTVPSTFYNDAATDHHRVTLNQSTTFDILEWIVYHAKEGEGSASIYKVGREF